MKWGVDPAPRPEGVVHATAFAPVTSDVFFGSKYAKERAAFGQAIGRYQAIEFKIARMEARAHAARTAYYDAAALIDSSPDSI